MVRPNQVYIPSFVDLWGFHTASDTIDPSRLKPGEINKRIKARIGGNLRSYDGIAHSGLFSLTATLRRKLRRGKKVITDESPISVY